jgi:hypothetical protein
MTEASRPRDQVIVCKGQRNFERIWIWFVISFRPGCLGLAGGRPWCQRQVNFDQLSAAEI